MEVLVCSQSVHAQTNDIYMLVQFVTYSYTFLVYATILSHSVIFVFHRFRAWINGGF